MSKKSLLQDKYYSNVERVMDLRMQSEIKQAEEVAYRKGYFRGYLMSGIYILTFTVIFIIIKAWINS